MVMSLLKATLLLGTYWLIAAPSFIWTSYMLTPFGWIRLIGAIGLLLLSLLLIILLTKFLKNNPIKELVVSVPLLVSLIGSLLILWLLDVMVARFVVLAILLSLFIGVFNFVLYFEDIKQPNDGHTELLHHKYLEYGRSFFGLWLSL
ncbi:hypothetical protein M1N05_01775 [Dehalococcoidales bacterium]|nr:hypothetical protein [Dehalococcoidales bacterium]MCL0091623.1 hypothetical protein [Dehalococcoidales bacterium]